MKYVLVLILGVLTGAALFGIALIYNPFVGKGELSPLSVTDAPTITLNYSAVPAEGVVFTNNGESRIDPYPEKVLQLWEAPIRQTTAAVRVLRDGRSQVAGLGIKISSVSESTRLIGAQAIKDSVWYVYLPGRGAMFIEQTENYWDYIRDVIIPAYRSSADTWKGIWMSNMTAGPLALGTAKVTGGSGEFADTDMLGVEILTLRAWRVEGGPIAAEGQLLIELPVEYVDDLAAEESLADEE